MGGCSVFRECRWLPYFVIAGGKLSDQINHYGSELNINITIKKIIRKLEKTYLPISRRQEIQVSRALYLKTIYCSQASRTNAGVRGSHYRGCVRRQHTF